MTDDPVATVAMMAGSHRMAETFQQQQEQVSRMAEQQQQQQQQQEEGVLNDVLQELDRERSRRAELEAQVRKLQDERASTSASVNNKGENQQQQQQNAISRREWIAMETERTELVNLIDSLTSDNDAIANAAKASSGSGGGSSSLPLHVIRLLEIVPWDERAQQHAFATEEVYEWQIYDKVRKVWIDELRLFPAFFKTMPITKPKPGSTMKDDDDEEKGGPSVRARIFGGERPPNQCVMTNASTTRVLNIKDGFPLPSDGGTWQWIGGWRINKRIVVNDGSSGSGGGSSSKKKIDCDDDGWSYTENPRNFQTNPTELCWDHAGLTGKRTVRRRKWTRRRALLSYPYASDRTEHYLALMAENSRLDVMINKLSDQLVETKLKLTESEEVLMHATVETSSTSEQLKEDLKVKETTIKQLNRELEEAKSRISDLIDNATKVDQLKSQLNAKDDLIRAMEFELSATTGNSTAAGGSGGGDVETIKRVLKDLEAGDSMGAGEGFVRDRSASDGDSRNSIAVSDDDDGDAATKSESQRRQQSSSSSAGELGGSFSETFDWKRLGRNAAEKIKMAKSLPWNQNQDSNHSGGSVASMEELSEEAK